MDIIVPQVQQIQDTSTPTYNTFNEATFGAGSTQVKINSDGLFVGGENFESAPFSVDYNGNVTISSGSLPPVSFDQITDGTNSNTLNVGSGNVKIDGPNKRITVNDGSFDRILMGYLPGKF